MIMTKQPMIPNLFLEVAKAANCWKLPTAIGDKPLKIVIRPIEQASGASQLNQYHYNYPSLM